MMSHTFENYFHTAEHTDFQDRMCESLLITVMETAPKLLNDLEDYEYRATILYCGTMALNGMLSMGYRGGIGLPIIWNMRYQQFMIFLMVAD